MAENVLQPQQLKMFMSANEIRQQHRIHGADYIGDIRDGKLTSPYGNPKVSDFFVLKRAEAEASGKLTPYAEEEAA